MFKLMYYSDFSVHPDGEYPNVDACAQDCQTRYRVKDLKFGQDDSGVLYTILYTSEGLVVLKLYEVERAQVRR
jgi:hypothetical protein